MGMKAGSLYYPLGHGTEKGRLAHVDFHDVGKVSPAPCLRLCLPLSIVLFPLCLSISPPLSLSLSPSLYCPLPSVSASPSLPVSLLSQLPVFLPSLPPAVQANLKKVIACILANPAPHANKVYNLIGEYQAGNQIVRRVWSVLTLAGRGHHHEGGCRRQVPRCGRRHNGGCV